MVHVFLLRFSWKTSPKLVQYPLLKSSSFFWKVTSGKSNILKSNILLFNKNLSTDWLSMVKLYHKASFTVDSKLHHKLYSSWHVFLIKCHKVMLFLNNWNWCVTRFQLQHQHANPPSPHCDFNFSISSVQAFPHSLLVSFKWFQMSFESSNTVLIFTTKSLKKIHSSDLDTNVWQKFCFFS